MIIFDIKGKFAHFRKYDTNSSSLTYWVPPRTTICGLIAAIAGEERDSYYEQFSPDQASIGVKVLGENRKVVQSLNYWKIESLKHFRTPKDHTQIPFEVLTNSQQVAFRIYFHHCDDSFMELIRAKIKNNSSYYVPYMGAAPFQCQIEMVEFFDCKDACTAEKIPISTVMKIDEIQEGTVEFDLAGIKLSRERMPRYFDGDRYLKEAASYLVEIGGSPLNLKYNGRIQEVTYADDREYITFM